MKMKIRIVEERRKVPDFCIDVKLGQKRKGWTRVRFRSLERNDHGCQICDFSRTCNLHDPICAAIISEITVKGYYVTTPPHFCLCRV